MEEANDKQSTKTRRSYANGDDRSLFIFYRLQGPRPYSQNGFQPTESRRPPDPRRPSHRSLCPQGDTLKNALLLLFACLASGHALAAGPNFDGKVSRLSLNKVDLAASDAVPAWVEAGRTVQAFGWEAVIQEVRGDVVTLRLDVNKLSKVKVGDVVSIRAPANEEPQMCGS